MCLNPLKIHNSVRPIRVPKDITDDKAKIAYIKHVRETRLDWIEVPCGRCAECMKKRGSEWRTRVMHEYLLGNHSSAIFVTLTINPQNYDKYKDDPQSAVRRFTDLYRKRYGHSLRYFLVTEKGSHAGKGNPQGRLHFHGILFGARFVPNRKNPLIKRVNRVLKSLWKIGHTWTGWCSPATVTYITKYITKYDSNTGYIPRVFVSPGLGKSAIDSDFIRRVHRDKANNIKIHCNGRMVSAPRYYLTKACTESELRIYSLFNQILRLSTPPYWLSTFSDYSVFVQDRTRRYNLSLQNGSSFRSRSYGSLVCSGNPLECFLSDKPTPTTYQQDIFFNLKSIMLNPFNTYLNIKTLWHC
jgi:hypothetical protein